MSALDDLGVIRARAPRVVVIGDYLLDGWWSGDISRLAREAPAPVVDVVERVHAPGGAANTAMNLAALGARVEAVGVVGEDEAGRSLRAALSEAGVDITRLRPVAETRTTTKVRVMSGDQLMLRIDETHEGGWPQHAIEGLVADALAATDGADAQLICDYGSTLLSDAVVAALGAGSRPALRVVDAHDLARWRGLEPDLVTPNAGETERVLGAPLGAGEERPERVAAHAADILAASGAHAAVVTLDRTGTVLLQPGHPPLRTHAHPTPEKQASGAGDVFVAALTVAAAAGLPVTSACALAQQAADVAVRKPGTCVCSLDELAAWAGRPSDAALTADQLAAEIERHRAAGERIVFTNGCFDVLHRGHTSYLRQAKRLGDVLVVAVNGDDSVRRLKGPDRPVNGSSDRANVLAALECVDYVTVFDEDTPSALIRRLRPDVYAKGGDYTPEMLAETAEVRAVGGEVAILDYVSDHSTTEILGRIRAVPAATEGMPPR
ncbi:D-glycero-beta-D-manno-heptose 1-phosphate adenylyltransferase [Microbacterium oryzae]|uniref:D-glycero-beta-D-manno-heptose 1-phosphate adenylyltransferase n=1 Tax=Microbacterium oryzae TaxID=743009 RepID=UPI0025B050CA|nr:D-glycero-beta-D-manno-heptose 1-phosphate adenylyltransferase [Microbacterium oryzae]MDN3309396.1 D-glycero-beta-D-manno-heptose 1-phosphate adenylyltransferase [Microbacterium oryzae]